MLQEQLQQAINNKTKPLGALGVLETIALQTGMIQGTLRPVIRHPYIVVFAGDHGIAATGLVNPYPQAVTAQMVLNFLHGGAAINVFTRQHHIELIVVDAGVNHDFTQLPDHPHFIHAKIAQGTHNYLEAPAMSREQANAAIAKGKEIVHQLATKGCNCIGFGEMGIGNTSSASLIMNALTGLSIEACTGRGTGASDEQLQTKIRTLETVAQKHHLKTYDKDAIGLLSKVGGFEIAMMTGAYLQAAKEKMVILVDGFIATAALLIAKELDPVVLDHCIFAHHSGEHGHEKMLQHLEARPLVQLGMRLGEGTGAALAIPLVQSAVNFLYEMASFESAGIEKKSEE